MNAFIIAPLITSAAMVIADPNATDSILKKVSVRAWDKLRQASIQSVDRADLCSTSCTRISPWAAGFGSLQRQVLAAGCVCNVQGGSLFGNEISCKSSHQRAEDD